MKTVKHNKTVSLLLAMTLLSITNSNAFAVGTTTNDDFGDIAQTDENFALPDIVTSAETDAGFKEDIVVTEYTGQTDYCFTLYTILPRELEKCRITQDILCWAKRLDRSTTWCNARERHKARRRRDK